MLSVATILLLIYSSIILLAFGGNLLVCIAVFCDRILRRRQENLFLVSLAVSDLLVSVLVMSFAAANDILGYWPFRHLYCQLWICFDITCTTASILNLSAIALHRFLHISRPLVYVRRRKICVLIAFVWLTSASIGFTQIILELAQRNEENSDMDENGDTKYNDSRPRCELRLKPLYALGSSMCSFVIPAAMMVLLYTRLYLFARKHAKIMRTQLHQAVNFVDTPHISGSIPNDVDDRFRILNICRCCRDPVISKRTKSNDTSTQLCVSDQKARLTLGVIIGTFLICWLPFFIVNVIRSFLPVLVSDVQFKAVTWLGYANSTANPIIYTILNRDFRTAFKKILFDNALCLNRDTCPNESYGLEQLYGICRNFIIRIATGMIPSCSEFNVEFIEKL
uniref:G-protein coupled receptors family 1 profile domain-containing protein n=1 Tax=Setaria digitata TaxID=48799 RepID=A0A915PS00_9BILA